MPGLCAEPDLPDIIRLILENVRLGFGWWPAFLKGFQLQQPTKNSKCALLLMFTRRVVACVAPTINSNSADKEVLGGEQHS